MQVPALEMSVSDSRSSGGSANSVAANVIDATVLTLCTYESLMKVTDIRKVRTMLEREVDRAGEGFIHLTPLFVYLWSVAKPWYATGEVMACVREIATSLQQRGVKVRLPDAYRFPGKPRAATGRAPGSRAPVGTRAGDRRQRTPHPARDA